MSKKYFGCGHRQLRATLSLAYKAFNFFPKNCLLINLTFGHLSDKYLTTSHIFGLWLRLEPGRTFGWCVVGLDC